MARIVVLVAALLLAASLSACSLPGLVAHGVKSLEQKGDQPGTPPPANTASPNAAAPQRGWADDDSTPATPAPRPDAGIRVESLK